MPLDLRALNPAQLEAVKTPEGPTLIVAGPGTGKTSALAFRIAYLLETKNVAPSSILALTFTNKAAQEMHDRVATLSGGAVNCSNLWIGTFHALGLMILREQGHRIGLPADFRVLSEYEQADIVGGSLSQILPKESGTRIKKWIRCISEHKRSQTNALSETTCTSQFPEELFIAYEKRLTELAAIDFDDLILKPLRLFRESSQIKSRYQARFQHFLVDEYQDVDNAQYELLRELSWGAPQVWVIGDADQAIYAFRGSQVEHFLRFRHDYPAAPIITLETNYRSSAPILRAAQAVIGNNSQHIPYQLIAANPEGPPLNLLRAPDDKVEARLVVKEIENLVGGVRMESSCGDGESFGFSEIAILYRLHHLAHPFCELLEQSGIPYQVIGQSASHSDFLWEQVIPYLKMSLDPHDDLSFQQVLSIKERHLFSPDTLSGLSKSAREANCSLYAFLQSPVLNNVLDPEQAAAAGKLLLLLQRFQRAAQSSTLQQLIESICRELKVRNRGRGEYALEWLLQAGSFHEGIAYENAPRFLEWVALMKEGEAYDPKAEAVTLMTVHAAKGLEFPVVFMVALESGIFPCTQFGDESADLEEERRLFYVGMTRAKKRLYFSCCQKGTCSGNSAGMLHLPLLRKFPGS